MHTPDEIEKINSRKYSDEYSIEDLSIHQNADQHDFFQKLIKVKLLLIKKYGKDKNVLDVGCGTGDYLFALRSEFKSAEGLDYTPKAIQHANAKKLELNTDHIHFQEGNARQLPFSDQAFDLVYSFSALYSMPNLHEVVNEMARVTIPQGIVILEMGNKDSINSKMCEYYPELSVPCYISLTQMKDIIQHCRLKIVEWRAFQLWPYWGTKPVWLKPFLLPIWKRMFQKEFRGKMLDEWLSNALFLKHFAFRHIIVCQK